MKSVTHDLISPRRNELAGITGNSYYPAHTELYGPRVMHINDAFFIYGTWGEPEDKFPVPQLIRKRDQSEGKQEKHL